MCFLSVHSQQITSRKKILYIPPCHKQLGLIFRFKENSKTAIAPVAVKFWTANLKSPQRGTNNCEMYHQAAGTADFAAFAGDRSPEPADSVVSLAANVTCHGADRGKTKKAPQLDNNSASCFNASLNLQTYIYIYISHTHTHLLRMAIANCEVECILRAKNSSVAWKDWKGCQKKSSCSFRLKVGWRLQTEVKTDCDNRTGKGPNNRSRQGGSRVSHVPWRKLKICRYAYTPMLSGLRWPGQTIMGSWRPAHCYMIKSVNVKKQEVLHLFRWFTHAPQQRGFLEDASRSRMCFHRKSKYTEKCKGQRNQVKRF